MKGAFIGILMGDRRIVCSRLGIVGSTMANERTERARISKWRKKTKFFLFSPLCLELNFTTTA